MDKLFLDRDNGSHFPDSIVENKGSVWGTLRSQRIIQHKGT